jgi:hypothetical protein
MQRIIATFHPQVWVNNYAVDVDPEGECDFDVTEHFVSLGEKAARAVRDYDDSSDALAALPQAPEWVRNWTGPFFVTVEESSRDYFEMLQVAWDWA